MKQYFVASIILNGILGGAVIADDEGLTFKTGKLTVPAGIRNLEMKYEDIQGISRSWFWFFPIFNVALTNGDSYRFIIFGSRRFFYLMAAKGLM